MVTRNDKRQFVLVHSSSAPWDSSVVFNELDLANLVDTTKFADGPSANVDMLRIGCNVAFAKTQPSPPGPSPVVPRYNVGISRYLVDPWRGYGGGAENDPWYFQFGKFDSTDLNCLGAACWRADNFYGAISQRILVLYCIFNRVC